MVIARGFPSSIKKGQAEGSQDNSSARVTHELKGERCWREKRHAAEEEEQAGNEGASGHSQKKLTMLGRRLISAIWEKMHAHLANKEHRETKGEVIEKKGVLYSGTRDCGGGGASG